MLYHSGLNFDFIPFPAARVAEIKASLKAIERDVHPSVLDWWRCDACGHAVPWHKDGKPQLDCFHCGAQLPRRYDESQK